MQSGSYKHGFKSKRRQPTEHLCVEPTRRSVYDILVENMQILQRNVFVHRIIYMGEHSFPADAENHIGKHFRKNIEHINAMYCEEFLTGFLLHCSKHFIHVLDGSEDGIIKHLELLFSSKDTKNHIENVKVLVAYHNISQRFLKSWMETYVRPAKLLQRIGADLDAAEAQNKILICVKKLYKFAYLLKTSDEENNLDPEISKSKSQRKRTTFVDPIIEGYRKSIIPVTSSESNMVALGLPITRFQNSIPELQLIEFLLETPHTISIHEFMSFYGSVPLLFTYEDYCWPVKTDFIPRNIFDDEYDPVTDIFEPPSEPEIMEVSV